jgi:hypothetical protein
MIETCLLVCCLQRVLILNGRVHRSTSWTLQQEHSWDGTAIRKQIQHLIILAALLLHIAMPPRGRGELTVPTSP